MGFLVKTKMKAYAKLTVVMCCQIVARGSLLRHLAAISGGDRRRGTSVDDQEFLREKVLVK